MTDLTPEQIEKWAGDELFKRLWDEAAQMARAERPPHSMESYFVPIPAILHAHAKMLQQQAENAEQQATIERLEEKGRAFMNTVFLNDGDVVGAGAAFAEVLNDLQDAAKQALQEAGE